VIEEIIVNQLIKDKEFYSITFDEIARDTRIFQQSEIKRIVDYMKYFVEEKRIKPSFSDILIFLENDSNIDEKSYKNIKKTLGKIKKQKFDLTFQVLKDESLKFLQDRLLMLFLERGACMVNGDNKDDSSASLLLEMRRISDISFESDLGLSLDDECFDEYDESIVPLGYKPIDDLFGGGLPKSSMTVFLAGPHAGKSQTKMFIAVKAAMAGQKVGYVSGEMRTSMTRQRIDSIAFQIATLNINSTHMTKEKYKQLWKDIRKKMKGNVYIKYFPSQTASSLKVGKWIEDLKNKKNYVIDLLVVDSINLMKPVDSRIPRTQKHIWMEAITIDFRQMIDEQDVSLITSAQLNREGLKMLMDGADPDFTVIGEFFMLAGFADAMVGMKKMYIQDDQIFHDKYFSKIIDDEVDLTGIGTDFFNVVKYNIIKSRFGTVVGDYMYLGSCEKYSSLVDLSAPVAKRKKTKNAYKKETIEENERKMKEKLHKVRDKELKECGIDEMESHRDKRKKRI